MKPESDTGHDDSEDKPEEIQATSDDISEHQTAGDDIQIESNEEIKESEEVEVNESQDNPETFADDINLNEEEKGHVSAGEDEKEKSEEDENAIISSIDKQTEQEVIPGDSVIEHSGDDRTANKSEHRESEKIVDELEAVTENVVGDSQKESEQVTESQNESEEIIESQKEVGEVIGNVSKFEGETSEHVDLSESEGTPASPKGVERTDPVSEENSRGAESEAEVQSIKDASERFAASEDNPNAVVDDTSENVANYEDIDEEALLGEDHNDERSTGQSFNVLLV